MPKSTKRVLVLQYRLSTNDFLMKRNEIRPAHLAYLRQCSKQNGGKVEFKVAESLNGKSFYWSITASRNEIKNFMHDDPYYTAGLVRESTIYEQIMP